MAYIVHEDEHGNLSLESGAPIRSHKDFPLHMWKGTKRGDGSAIDYVCTVLQCSETWTLVFDHPSPAIPLDEGKGKGIMPGLDDPPL